MSDSSSLDRLNQREHLREWLIRTHHAVRAKRLLAMLVFIRSEKCIGEEASRSFCIFQSTHRYDSSSWISHGALVRVACAAAIKYEKLLHQENFTRALLREELSHTSKIWRQASMDARSLLSRHHPQLRRIVLLPPSLWPTFSEEMLDEIQAEGVDFADSLPSSKEVDLGTALQTYQKLLECLGQQGAAWLLEFARHGTANSAMNATRDRPLFESLQWLSREALRAAPLSEKNDSSEDEGKELLYVDDIPPLLSMNDYPRPFSVEEKRETRPDKRLGPSSERSDPEAEIKACLDHVEGFDRQGAASGPHTTPPLRALPFPRQDAPADAFDADLFTADDDPPDGEWEKLNRSYLSAQGARESALRSRLCRLIGVEEDRLGQGLTKPQTAAPPSQEEGKGQTAAASPEACRFAYGSSEAADSMDPSCAVREVRVPFLGLEAARAAGVEEEHYCVMCELGGSLSGRGQNGIANASKAHERDAPEEGLLLVRCAGCKALVHGMCAYQGGQHTANFVYCSKFCCPRSTSHGSNEG